MVEKPRLGPLAIWLALESVSLIEADSSSLKDSSHQRHLISTKCTTPEELLGLPPVFPSHSELLLFKWALGSPWITLSFPPLPRGHWGWEQMSNFYFILLLLLLHLILKRSLEEMSWNILAKWRWGFHPVPEKYKTMLSLLGHIEQGFPICWSQSVCYCRSQ